MIEKRKYLNNEILLVGLLLFVGIAFHFWIGNFTKSISIYPLKFYTKSNGKPVESRLPVFCLHVVYRPDLMVE